MKKMILALFLFCLVSVVHAADPTAVSLGSQVQIMLLTEGVTVSELTTTGKEKIEVLDGIVGIGKYNANVAVPYWLVVDAGAIQDAATQNTIGGTIGIHANIAQFIGSYVTMSPSAATLWSYLNLTPRVSYDSDVHGHAIVGVIGGVAIPFK